ncbi:hypothetical protein [Flavobacterium selenitireducens]|uniref:hypothetical protein n=1 Tax=Flavobacterium selenitireducens TaxID=2722704 RepID=UPI00168A93C6|nr:hypothetical protein [Flavobacterium selenitireducens]MBD3581332.1 hypothetical protein [Flavobacterium selenitireducens]
MKNRIISVFKTSVTSQKKALLLRPYLDGLRNISQWNFDLEDRDKILRIDSESPVSVYVIGILNRKGFDCIELE